MSSLDCQQNIPASGPSPSDVANSLQSGNGIETICNAKFDGSGDALHQTFNHGSLLIVIERGSNSEELTYCQAAIKAIIAICILGSSDYGGVYYQGNQKYNIINEIFPNNPLLPGVDQGAPPVTTPTLSPTRTLPSAQTVTSNGQVCVLIQGSNDPACHPESTPTPNPDGTNIVSFSVND
jgi:hypothetical protein